MEHPAEAVYQFGPFRLESSEHRLLRDGEPVSLPHKAFEVLLALVENPGRLVLKEDLLKRVWPESFVEEANLAVAVSQLRKLLCDRQNGEHRYIETVRSIGYRFVAPVQTAEPMPEAHAQITPVQSISAVTVLPPEDLPRKAPGLMRRWPAPLISGIAVSILALLFGFNAGGWRDRLLGRSDPPHIESIAVLPLENLSRDPSEEYFADGMTEELITDLSKIGTLRVISRTSVMHYKGTSKTVPEIARELNVDALIAGSVLRSGTRVRITAQLVEANNDKHLWAERYERDLRDVLALQSEVAAAISDQIKVRLTPQEQTRLTATHPINAEAYEAYLRGLNSFHQGRDLLATEKGREPMARAIHYFEHAAQLDPSYALAYARLARTYNWLASTVGPEELYADSKRAALKALQMDDTLAEAHASLAFVLFIHDWDWDTAGREFRRAVELSPNYDEAHHGYALYLEALGKNRESIEEINRAQELDPLTLPLQANVGYIYACARQYDRALAKFRSLVEQAPDNPDLHGGLGAAYVESGIYDKGLLEIKKSMRLSGNDPHRSAVLGWAYAKSGRKHEALQIAERLKMGSKNDLSMAVPLAVIYATLGDADQAIEWLQTAYQRHSHVVAFIKCEPAFDSLRSDPRFQDLLRRIGLPL